MNEPEAIRILTQIFIKKDWFPKDDREEVYNAFYKILNVISEDERKLLLELTDRFLWITGSEYEKGIKSVLNLITPDIFNGVSKIFLFPIMKTTDVGKAKSGISMVYDIKALAPKLINFKNIALKPIDKFEDFAEGYGSKENELLFLVDDFIGTGETLQDCLTEIRAQLKIPTERIIVISISCQQNTYNFLLSEGFKVYTQNIVPKGISDFNSVEEIKLKFDIMQKIEKSIPGSSSVSLGYKESEAVISLKRTPDNTFPIFWKRLRKNGILLNAPFFRENN